MLDDQSTYSYFVWVLLAESRAATNLFRYKLPHYVFCWLPMMFWEANSLQEDRKQHCSRHRNSADPLHPVVLDHQNIFTLPTVNFITSNIWVPAGLGPDFPLKQQMLLLRPFRIAQQACNQILYSGALPWSVLFPQLAHSTCIYFVSLQGSGTSSVSVDHIELLSSVAVCAVSVNPPLTVIFI